MRLVTPARQAGRSGGLRRIAGGGAITVILAVTPAGAQIDTTVCESVAGASLCRAAAELSTVMTVRGASIAVAGNPVAGTASTIGRRTPRMPRLAFSVRRTVGSADLPSAAGAGNSTSATSWSGEASVGLFDGFSPLPTVGGLFSVDMLGSVSLVQFPSSDGFRTRAPSSFALGARVGVFRESFTMPGISLSVMYRRTGRLTFGDIDLLIRDLHVRVDRVGTWSTRAVVGKRMGLFGFTAGAGWDRHTGRGSYRVGDAAGTPVAFEFRGLDAERRIVFGGLSWTVLVFNFSGEVAWQFEETDEGDIAGDGGLFGGLGFRVTF